MRTGQLIMICILVAGSIYGDRTVDNKNGTLTDKKTGLTWELCNKGECSYYDYFDAKERCDSLSLAGKKWRLPTIKELFTIYAYDYDKMDFIFDSKDVSLWSNTRAETRSSKSNRYVLRKKEYNGSNIFGIYIIDKDHDLGVICVSGELRNDVLVDNKNGTVMDKSTKLLWQKCNIGENDYLCSGEATSHNWEDAKKQCQNLKLAGKKWRLPTIGELISIAVIDIYKRMDISFLMDIRFFPNTCSHYWSSNTHYKETEYAYYVDFYSRYTFEPFSDNAFTVSNRHKADSLYVRCVTDP